MKLIKLLSPVALLMFFLLAGTAQAQETGRIAGTVTDSLNGGPLPGVNVVIEGTSRGSATNAEGGFEITGVEAGTHDVRASFVGYEPKVIEGVEVNAGETTELDIELVESAVALEEIVAVGYGVQRREDITGSVSSVNVEETMIGPISSPQELIQGRAAGVSVTQNSGEPGSGMTVRIRGGTSINASNDPLYVIDGVPVENSAIEPGGFGAQRNPLNFLDANDIESIDILKDAAATAIYGARGANGVVLITTRSGQSGRVQVDYNSSVSSSIIARKLDLLSGQEYRSFVEEQVAEGNLSESRLEELGDANTDWQDAVTRTAVSHQHNLALSSGIENAQFRASLGYADNQGIIINSSQQRITGRFSGDLQAFDNRLRLTTDVSSVYLEDDHTPYEETGGFVGAAFAGVVKFNPTLPVREGDGSFTEYSESTRNPVAAARQIDDLSETSRTIANFTAEVDVVQNLVAKVNVGGEYSESVRRTYMPRTSPFGRNVGGRAEQDKNERTSGLVELTSTYSNAFGAHNVNAVGGYSYQVWINEGFGAAGEEFITDAWLYNNLGGGGNEELIPYSYKNENKLASVFGRLNYDYDGRYLASLSLRRDGSSRFGEENRWGLFPSVSVAWRASRDLPLPETVNNLMLRVGYGETGNQEIGNYLSLQTLSPGFRAVFGQQANVGVAPNQFANPNLQWEETATFNVGVDYGFLDDRIRGELEYYRKDTDNLLVDIPVPQPAVVGSRVENVGKVRNTGIEFSIEAQAIQRENLGVSFDANISTNNNEVVSLGGRDQIFYGSVSGPGLSGVQSFIIRPGLPIGSFFGPVFAGFEDGEQVFYTYEDTNGDGFGDQRLEETTTNPSSEDRQVIGNAQPDFIYGFGANVDWGSWELNASFHGKYGQDIFNNTALTYAAKTHVLTNNNFLASALEDPTGIEESPVYSSRWIQDGSYLRLESVTLGYTFENLPQVQRARVYVRGGNLFVLTSYDGYDPELTTHNTGALPGMGVDYLNYPRPRTFTLGVNFSF